MRTRQEHWEIEIDRQTEKKTDEGTLKIMRQWQEHYLGHAELETEKGAERETLSRGHWEGHYLEYTDGH